MPVPKTALTRAPQTYFEDRLAAGAALAELIRRRGVDVSFVCAVPPSGLEIGLVTAAAYSVPLQIAPVARIRHPHSSTYAIGAVSSDGELVIEERMLRSVDGELIRYAISSAHQKARERRVRFKTDPMLSAHGKSILVVGDGFESGYAARVTVRALRRHVPLRIVVAAPVMPSDIASQLRSRADEVITVLNPHQYLGATSFHYRSPSRVSEADIVDRLSAIRERRAS